MTAFVGGIVFAPTVRFSQWEKTQELKARGANHEQSDLWQQPLNPVHTTQKLPSLLSTQSVVVRPRLICRTASVARFRRRLCILRRIWGRGGWMEGRYKRRINRMGVWIDGGGCDRMDGMDQGGYMRKRFHTSYFCATKEGR